MLEKQRRSIWKKIKQPAETKHQGGLTEYTICCYNCKHCKIKKKNLGYCHIDNDNPKKIISVRTTNCTQHNEVELLECEICGKFYRALSYHVPVHGITISEYKLLYGYNSSTGLVCSQTSKLMQKNSQANIEMLRKHSPIRKGHKIQMKKGERIVVEEALINMRKAKLDELSNKPRSVGPNKGKKLAPLSNEHKQKISEALKDYYQNNPKQLKRLLKNAEYGRRVYKQQLKNKKD
jgi:hypothetical protein